MPHLFELLQKREINVLDEYVRLIDLFKKQPIYYGGMTVSSVIDEYVFRKLEIRQSFLDIDDLLNCLRLHERTTKLNDLLLLTETLSTIIFQSKPYLNDIYNGYRIDFDKRVNEIYDNISYIIEKCNHELKVIDNYCWVLEKNKLTSQAVEFIYDETVALEAIEYNHYLLKGDPEKKKTILLSLGHHIEPILQSKKLSNNGYKQLESNAGFMLNNFNIRHNNNSGKKENEFIKNITPKELEEWYDKAYNTILMVIVADKEIDTNNDIEKLKTEFTFKS